MPNKKIVGYFHICQKPGWEKSFDLIFPKIKESGLYDATDEINIGIVNNDGHVIDDFRLNDPKFKITYFGGEENYERPTLYLMRTNVDIYPADSIYWYVHSKGLRHFGQWNESCVIDWIKFLVYWNIEKWNIAVKILEMYDTYGCNKYENIHYSGNFWWTTSSHLKNLPVHIEDYYTAPEDWICIKKDKMFNIYSSGLQGCGHYSQNLDEDSYRIPDDFDIIAYYIINTDIQHVGLEGVVWHYLNHGRNEGRAYKYEQVLPDGFDKEAYFNINTDIQHVGLEGVVWHYLNHGRNEGRAYKYEQVLPDGFNKEAYFNINTDIQHLGKEGVYWHYLNHGCNEGRTYKYPDNYSI